MTDLRQLETDLAELAQLRERCRALDIEVSEWKVQAATLARRLDISERQRSIHAARVGDVLRALSNVGLIINDVIDQAQKGGFQPAPVEPVAVPTPAEPLEGGGKVDDGKPVPQFLTQLSKQLNGGKDDVQQPVRG